MEANSELKADQVRILKKDVGFRRAVWVKKGEKVKILSISGNAVIFQTEKGAKFPCNIKDLE